MLSSFQTRWFGFAMGVALMAGPMVSWAGGGPQNTLVVVNDRSLESLELGHYYQSKRGIPDRNICHIRTAVDFNISTTDFTNQLRQPILNYISTAGLSNQIDYIVFSRDIPYRVYRGTSSNGLTAAMFYDFKTGPICDNPGNASKSDYFEAERAFLHGSAPSSNRYYISTILTSTNLAFSKQLVDRSVDADSSQPTGTVYLFHTLDPRNVQWFQFEDTDFRSRFLDIPEQRVLLDGYFTNAVTNAMGVMVGQSLDMPIAGSTFVRGALGDHLTSYGGVLYENSAQQSIIDWIRSGCDGSYGTVLEPCVDPEGSKFPRAQVHFWYGRGFNMGESYWMSVRNPYQGVFVGDPLCAPYAVPPTATVLGVTNGQLLAGTISLTVTGLASSVSRSVSRIDMLLDGVFLATLTNVVPTRSNVVTVAINGTNCDYVVRANMDIFNVATGLAASINSSNLGFRAQAYGDRIEIRQVSLGVAGASLACVGSSSTGSAGAVTVYTWSPRTNFLETAYYAHEQLTLSGVPVAGDVLRLVVTNLAGVTVTNEAVASASDDRNTLLRKLASAVNSDPNLQGGTGCEMKWVTVTNVYIDPIQHEAYLVARTNTWQGYNLHVTYSVVNQAGSTLVGPGFTDHFNDNSNVLSARATIFLSEGRTNLVGTYSLVTTNLADGPHELTAVVYEGTAVRTQGRVTIPFVVDNNAVACAITNPPTGGTALLSESVTAYVQASSVTSVEFYVEGKRLASTNAIPYVFSFAATNYGVGSVTLQAKAYASTGESVLSSNVTVTILPDYDFDSLDDNWEIQNWGSITNYTGVDDPDSDSVNNADEYTADTQPTNNANYFKFNEIQWIDGLAQLEFISSTARQYRLHYNDASLLDGAWMDSAMWLQGDSGVTTQLDDGTVMPLPTNVFRFYRVQAQRP
jgi:uncharacterized protein (TIGR03790 family)